MSGEGVSFDLLSEAYDAIGELTPEGIVWADTGEWRKAKSIYFYSSSFFIESEIQSNGYVEFFNIPSRRTLYAFTTQKKRAGETSIETSTEFYKTVMNLPDHRCVGIMAKVEKTDSTTSVAPADAPHMHEYLLGDIENVTTMPLTIDYGTDLDYPTEMEGKGEYKDAYDTFDSLAGAYTSITTSPAEDAGIASLFGHNLTGDATLSDLIDATLDTIAEDIFNTLTVSRYTFRRAPPFNLADENFEISPDEEIGMGALESDLRKETESPTMGPVPEGYGS